MRIVTLVQWTLAASVVAGTLLQFVGALYVREYAKGLWVREIREEERVIRMIERRVLSEEHGLGGLAIIPEEGEWEDGKL